MSRSPDRVSSPAGRTRSPTRSPVRSPSRRSRSPARSPGRDSNGATNVGNNIYVANLAIRTPEEDLNQMFAKYGKVTYCRLVRDPRSGDSRGFGFVTMDTVDEADEAIRHLDQTEVDGRVIHCEKAKRGRPRSPTPGRFLGNDASRRPTERFDRDRRGGDRYDRRDRGYDRDRDRGYDRGRSDGDRYRPAADDRDRYRSSGGGSSSYDDRDRYRSSGGGGGGGYEDRYRGSSGGGSSGGGRYSPHSRDSYR